MRDVPADCTNAFSLAQIANQIEGPWHEFSDDELERLWLQQLGADIQFDPSLLSGDMARKLVEMASHGTPVPNRFCDLFRHPKPPMELLEYTKQWAKSGRHHPDSPLQKVSTVLYYSSILVALMRCGQRITGLDNAALDFGTHWVLEQSWIDPSTRRLFAEAVRFLKAPCIS